MKPLKPLTLGNFMIYYSYFPSHCQILRWLSKPKISNVAPRNSKVAAVILKTQHFSFMLLRPKNLGWETQASHFQDLQNPGVPWIALECFGTINDNSRMFRNFKWWLKSSESISCKIEFQKSRRQLKEFKKQQGQLARQLGSRVTGLST